MSQYLNLDLNYRTALETVRLTGLLGRSAEILPIRLWCYCGTHHCRDGKLSGYTPQEVEAGVGWWGGSGQMVKAMLLTGFLKELHEGGYEVCGFMETNGHLSMFKDRAQKAADKRWKSSNATSNAKSLNKQCPNYTNYTNLKNNTNSVETPQEEVDTESYSQRVEEFFKEFPKDFVDTMKEGFPDKDIVGECKKAKAWLLSHPRNQKKDFKRFLFNWINRSNSEQPAPVEEKASSKGSWRRIL